MNPNQIISNADAQAIAAHARRQAHVEALRRMALGAKIREVVEDADLNLRTNEVKVLRAMNLPADPSDGRSGKRVDRTGAGRWVIQLTNSEIAWAIAGTKYESLASPHIQQLCQLLRDSVEVTW